MQNTKNVPWAAISSVFGLIVLVVIFVNGGLGNNISGKNQSAIAVAANMSTAANFSVLGAISTSSAASGTYVSGNLGLSPGLAVSRTGVWTIGGSEFFGPSSSAFTAQADALLAFNSLSAQTPDGLWASASPLPGVWNIALDTTFAGPTLTLNGTASDVWVFQIGQDMTFTGNVVLTGGAQACNVFWQVGRDTTIAASSNFVGTVIASRDITLASGANVDGRLISLNSSITTTGASHSISGPSCIGSPSALGGGGPLIISPLISVLKVPTPLALPAGLGLVTYNYTVSNIGIVPMSNVTVTDNKCSAVNFVSGDTNVDSKLDLNETWKYSCATTLSQTTSNTVTATGEANGITATDTADATVVVGVPIIPPLIHVVKKPNLFVLHAGGGPVTYMYTVTNPGTVPLSNVSITDDKCTGLPGRVTGHPGDLNKNDLLESNETWSFTCLTNLTETTTNTATAQGSANGLTAVDYASATVVVNSPTLPKTGFPPEENSPWNKIIPIGIFVVLFSVYLFRQK
jgi:uncharacterized repeat protein (TIGR01451 family)